MLIAQYQSIDQLDNRYGRLDCLLSKAAVSGAVVAGRV